MTEAPVIVPPTLVQKLSAEAIGTFVLVLFGCGVAVTSDVDLVATGLAFGLAVTLMAYAFGRVSGAHFNPAVSVGAAISGRIAWKDAGLYCAAQVAGGIAAALALLILFLGIDGFEAFETPLAPNGFSEAPFDYAVWAALLVELLMTAIFVLVILAVTDARNEHPALAPFAIGVTLAVIHFAVIPLTGTSVNPARSIGPALFSGGDWIVQLWPFLIAPPIGALLAGVAYPAIFGHGSEPVPGSGLNRAARAAAVPGYGAPDQYQQQWNQQAPDYAQPATGQQWAQPQEQQTPTPQAAQPAQQEQPIIQDGWQWDPQAQQWIPAQQPPAGGWPNPDAGGERTQIRPPEGQ